MQCLSKEENDAITPETEDIKVYSVLFKVVEQASKDNLSQAQLIKTLKSWMRLLLKLLKKLNFRAINKRGFNRVL